ncbi:MAG TPA: NlpC/P60 family protein [Micromonosporaceae bacterium]
MKPGEHAVVAVPVATLWRSPERIRPVDRAAVETPPDLRTWATMSAAEQDDLHGRTDSQLLLGDSVLVEEVRDGWVRCVVPSQATRHDPRGYPGWIPAAQLEPGDTVPASHVVDAVTSDLRAGLDGAIIVGGVVMGTGLAASGPVVDGWLPVALPGRTAWVPAADTAPLTTEGVGDPVRQAERLIGVRYIWGGMSPYGIDCSGLVHLSFRRLGVAVPRDASDQAAATVPLPYGDERRGDLYFFAKTGGTVTHVGFVAAPPDADGTRHMVHASGGTRVVAEPIIGERLDTLVGVHRVARDGSVRVA